MQVWSAERLWVRGRFEKDWAVLVDESGIIQGLGPRQQVVSRAKNVNHYPQSIILPAFSNPHHHSFHTLYRGLSFQSKDFQDYLTKFVYPFSSLIDDELFDAIYRESYAQLLRAGVATVGEFHYLHGRKDKSDPSRAEQCIEIALSMGLKISLIYVMFDQGDAEKTKAFIEPMDESIRQFIELQEKYKNHPKVQILPGAHSMQHTSAEAMIAVHDLAKKYKKPMHIQLGTSQADMDESIKQYGTGPVQALEKMGLLKQGLVVVHGNHLDQESLKLLKSCGAGLVLCPSSNLAKGEDLRQLEAVMQQKIPFCLGSELPSLNLAFSPPSELRQLEFALRASKHRTNVLAKKASEQMWEYISSVPNAMLGMQSGHLAPGQPADLICIPLDFSGYTPHWDFTPSVFLNFLWSAWPGIQGITQTVVQGQLAYTQPEFKGPYLDRARRKLNEWSTAFARSGASSSQTTETAEHA